jgi:hypothetical protein
MIGSNVPNDRGVGATSAFDLFVGMADSALVV